MEKRKITVAGQEVVLDTSKLTFSEATLDEYLETEGGWMDYFGAKLADAELQLMEAELLVDKKKEEYERAFARVFSMIKDTEGGSDKLTEGKAKVEATVVASRDEFLNIQQKVIEAKHVVSMLRQHLRAWDRNHENAQNRGNTLRKEMDRLHRDRILEDKVDDIIKAVDIP